MFGSKNTINETVKKIEAAATDVSLSVERTKHHKVQSAYTSILQPKHSFRAPLPFLQENSFLAHLMTTLHQIR